MKNKIFMYLFIFAVLLLIFQYVNSKKIFENYDKKLERYEQRENVFHDSIVAFRDANFELQYFDINFDDDALDYFEDAGFKSSELIPFIKDELYKLNFYEGDEHPIVPYSSKTKGKMLINQVKLLNHKWIIANFSDGKHWGQLLVAYEIENGTELKFEVLRHFMYSEN